MKPQMHRGYLRVQAWSEGKPRSLRVHRAVCEAFNGPSPKPDCVVEHLNHDKLDNRPENLRWSTQAENVTRSVSADIHPKGESNGQSILTEAAVRHIRGVPKSPDCVTGLARMYGVAKQTIGSVRSGTTWRHVK